jgi:hypothetical protein
MAAGEAEDVSGEGFRAAHDALLADPTLQFEFEVFQPVAEPAPQPSADWIEAIARFLEAIAPFLTYVFWAGLALIASLILYAVFKDVLARNWSRKPKASEAAPAPVEAPKFRPTIERARALLEEADRLAREGRFGEAVRVILHHSIDDMEQALAIIIPLSMTSREIAGLSQLSEQGRSVFGKIARAVELSLFGERPLTRDHYFECRREYEVFVFGAASA